jgi:microcystin-dependent protein
MCQKCNKKSCGGCGNNGNLEQQVASLQETVDKLLDAAGFLEKGNPIMLIQSADDIAKFDLTSGKGSEYWKNWAICNGATHGSIITPNFVDRFVVMATGTYATDAMGGAATVTLDASQIPSHTHAITDNGHTHNVTDTGHSHGVNDVPHTHTFSAAPHTHTLTIVANGNHEHETGFVNVDKNGGGVSEAVRNTAAAGGGNSTSTNGLHSHTGNADAATVGGSVGNAPTGVTVQSANTGITNQSATTGITLANTGGGLAHENMPPYYAAIYVMKVK